MRLRCFTFLLIAWLGVPSVFAQTAETKLLSKRNYLQSKRDDLQRNIHNIQLHLHDLERDRFDKLEELEQLSAAYRDVNKRFSFSAMVQEAITLRSDDLHLIEKERSDCLAVLDNLYSGLSRLNSEIAVVK